MSHCLSLSFTLCLFLSFSVSVSLTLFFFPVLPPLTPSPSLSITIDTIITSCILSKVTQTCTPHPNLRTRPKPAHQTQSCAPDPALHTRPKLANNGRH